MTPASNPYTIRRLRGDEIGEVCALFQRVFGVAMSPEHWRWKYAGSPALGAINVVAQNAAGQLVGHVGATVWAGELDGRTIRLAHACDVMVCPSARGGLGRDSLYRRMMVELDAALRATGPQDWPLFIYGFPGQTPARLGQRMGLYRPLRNCQVVQMDADSIPGPGVIWPWQRWRATPLSWNEALRQHDQCHGRAARTWPTAAGQPRLIKDAAYLRWRYAQHPDRHYQYWLLGRPWSRAQSWLVTRTQPSPPYIVDGGWGKPLTLEAIVKALRQATGVSAWSAWFAAGERPLAQDSPIIAVEFSGCGQFHPDWGVPDFQPGDTDVF